MIEPYEVWTANLNDAETNTQHGIRPVVILKYYKDIDRVLVTPLTSQVDKIYNKTSIPTHIKINKEYGLAKDSYCKLEHIKSIPLSKLSRKKSKITDRYIQLLLEAAYNVSIDISNDYLVEQLSMEQSDVQQLIREINADPNRSKLQNSTFNTIREKKKRCLQTIAQIKAMSHM